MEYLFLLQARLGSTRLPNKVLLDLLPGESLLDIIIKRIRQVRNVHATIIVLTTTNSIDDRLADYVQTHGIQCFRGDEHDVFKRFYDFLKAARAPADYFFRICADNPLIEPIFIEQMIECVESTHEQYDYVSFMSRDGMPAIQHKFGLFCELVKTDTFLNADIDGLTDYEKEHVTPIFYTHNKYNIKLLEIPHCIEASEVRCTIDTAEDAVNIQNILSTYGTDVTYKDLAKRGS